MEYISKSEAMSYKSYLRYARNDDVRYGAECVLTFIEGIPAADVVPVTRCKDCVYAWDRDGDGRLFCREFERSPSFFCADGQHRDFQEKSK